MAHRQEEKERRRQERLAREEAEQKAARRKRALGLIGGILLAAVAVGAIVLVLVSGDDNASVAEGGNFREAAAAAGCEFRQLDSEGRDHVDEPVKVADYQSNPPTSGPHSPVAAPDGFYQPGNEPDLGNWIHSLEHGRILFQFKPGTSQENIRALRDLANEELQGTAGYHTLVFQNNTNMRYPFAAVAWTRFVGCNELTPETLEVMRQFRATYTDQAPELIP